MNNKSCLEVKISLGDCGIYSFIHNNIKYINIDYIKKK